MSTDNAPSTLFEELATFFASAPNAEAILLFRPSEKALQRASELLRLNRAGHSDTALQSELEQHEQAERLMRLVKARVRENQGMDRPLR